MHDSSKEESLQTRAPHTGSRGWGQHGNENKQGAEVHLSLPALGFCDVGAQLSWPEHSRAMHWLTPWH